MDGNGYWQWCQHHDLPGSATVVAVAPRPLLLHHALAVPLRQLVDLHLGLVALAHAFQASAHLGLVRACLSCTLG